MKELAIRIMSGLVFITVIISSVLYSKESFYLVFYLLMILCLFEFKNLIKLSYKWTFLVATLIYFRFSHLPLLDFKYFHFFLIVSIFVPFIYQVLKPKVNLTSSKLGHYLLALVYISIPFTLLTQIYFRLFLLLICFLKFLFFNFYNNLKFIIAFKNLKK